MSGSRSPAVQTSRRRGVLSKHRWRAEPAKCSGNAVPRDRATDIARYKATSVTGHCAVRVRLELDVAAAVPVLLDKERSAAVLRVALCVADIEHLVQRDRGLASCAQLFHLAQHQVHVVVTSRARLGAQRVQMLAGLDYQETNGDRPGCMCAVMTTGCEGIVGPTTPCARLVSLKASICKMITSSRSPGRRTRESGASEGCWCSPTRTHCGKIRSFRSYSEVSLNPVSNFF